MANETKPDDIYIYLSIYLYIYRYICTYGKIVYLWTRTVRLDFSGDYTHTTQMKSF